MYFWKFYNLNLEINLTIGQIKGWKSKIYVTAVLDSFQDRKGIAVKEVNNKQVIGLYNKGGHEGDTPSPLARVSFSHRSIFESMWLSCACYGGHQDVISLFFFQPFAMAQIFLLLFGSVLLALSLSQEMSPRCLQLAVQKTNGCSVPAGLWAPYKNTFTPACYKHDFSYFCVRVTFFINTN